MAIQGNVLLYELIIYLMIAITIVFVFVNNSKKLKRRTKDSEDVSNTKKIKCNFYLLGISALAGAVLILWLSLDGLLDLLKKDYVYEEGKLSSITRKSYFNISYDVEFENNYLSLSLFYKKDFELKPGMKYGYYYGKRTKSIVGIKKLH